MSVSGDGNAQRQPTSGAGFLFVVALVAVGFGSYIVTRLSTRLEIVERNLESLQRAHDTLARRQAAVPRAPAPAAATPPKPTGPDPAKLYAVPIDDAPVRGAASAYVTMQPPLHRRERRGPVPAGRPAAVAAARVRHAS